MNIEAGRENCDALILGGGMSGLSLACHIADCNDATKGEPKSTWVIEPRTRYSKDKTWCFWQQQDPSLFDAAISHRWHRWLIKAEGRTHVCKNQDYAYVRVDSGRYYDIALARLNRSASVKLVQGLSVESVSAARRKVTAECGELNITADYVYDTRPKNIPAGTLLQHFVGWEIETDRDAFDPQTVTLMDFQASSEGDIHFFYVLPFSKRHALVESTHFSKKLLHDEVYAQELNHYLLAQLDIDNWQVLHEERGVLPMPKNSPTQADRAHFNVIPFGLHADTAKPSTGYCYPHAQRQAKHYANRLFAENPAQVPAARASLARWLDHVFISFLEHQPAHAASTFMQLFQRVPEPVLIRFLSDTAKATDYIRVVAAMPKRLFIREAIRCVRRA